MDTLINFCLDASGSMQSVAKPTVEGFNQFINEQKQGPGKAYLSLTLFNTEFHTRFIAWDINDVPEMSTHRGSNLYVPGGGTALYDAVGTTIKDVETWLAMNPWFQGQVVTAIFTDGEENSSKRWHLNIPMIPGDERDVNGLIEWKIKEGWEFVFLGAGQSAWLESQKFTSIAPPQRYAFTGTADSYLNTYAGVSNAMSHSRHTGQSYGSAFAERVSSDTTHALDLNAPAAHIIDDDNEKAVVPEASEKKASTRRAKKATAAKE